MSDDACKRFREFFGQAVGDNRQPYPYQERLACGPDLPELLDIPTGLGKTAAAILGWLFRRRFQDKAIRDATPRRLVYCLPMRVLVEQTHGEAIRWLDRLGLLAGDAQWKGDQKALAHYMPQPDADLLPDGWAKRQGHAQPPLAVHLLMGGEDRTDWALWPERDAILIGTQDMLLSRALNRGYAASRARWPTEFGLLNNDCLWVLDEVQLMGSGLATSAQLDAFRRGGKQTTGFGCYGPCPPLWMSATIQPDWLETVDHLAPVEAPFGLAVEERNDPSSDSANRLRAVKTLHVAKNNSGATAGQLAAEILTAHQELAARDAALTLVVVNAVRRATRLHEDLGKLCKKQKWPGELLLIHSRFRPPDRRSRVDQLLSVPHEGGKIVVSTQVVEAGVDVSAKVLFTEVAPWSSLVQRFGRCNRRGEYGEAHVVWIDVAEKDALPYDALELQSARERLSEIIDSNSPQVGPLALPVVRQHFRPRHVIRRKDLVDLFDTTPDLAGNDVDVSRYLRDGDEHDVYVCWRLLPESGPAPEEPAAQRQELCPVPIGEFRSFLTKQLHKSAHARLKRAFVRNFLERSWEPVAEHEIYPGQTYLLDASAGGYHRLVGWTGTVATRPQEDVEPNYIAPALPVDDGYDSDVLSESGWRRIAEHTDEVCAELENVMAALVLRQVDREALALAARWHDWGKIHDVFQGAVRDVDDPNKTRPPKWRGCRDVAKAPGRRSKRNFWRNYDRRHFRHELASALGILHLEEALIRDPLRDIVAYLVAAHHGKVRLSVRSLPGENRPADGRLFARGIWQDDPLAAVDLGGGQHAPAIVLDLECIKLGIGKNGRPSWGERMLSLRDAPDLGIFQLAYLEALLRAADCRASIKSDRGGALPDE